MKVCLQKIISGGQTGVDRAALDAAVQAGLEVGGWCPKDRWAEDGPIPDSYPVIETLSPDPARRTEWNIRDSVATLVLHRGRLTGGTALTVELAKRLGKPCLLVDLNHSDRQLVVSWLTGFEDLILNVAGPRESEEPGISDEAGDFLRSLFSALQTPRSSRRPG